MRKLNGLNVITGFQPILYSHYAACAQEMDQNIIEKNAAVLSFNKKTLLPTLVSITWHHLNDDITYSTFLIYINIKNK